MIDFPLFMVQMQFDARKIMIQASESGLFKANVDEGYYIHQQILEMFGKNVFSTFCIIGQKAGWINVLAYSSQSAKDLQELAKEHSSPLRYASCNWEMFSSKPMPQYWPTGKKYHFEVKTCPVVRIGKSSGKFKKGAEVDVFLNALNSEDSLKQSREQVYKKWGLEQFARSTAAKVESIRLEGFKRTKFLRRSQGGNRIAKIIERPEAYLKGEILIQDGEKFNDLMAKGIGRHRSFGFGMLLLKPQL